VTTSTFPAARDIGIAQQTTRGTARPLVPIMKYVLVEVLGDYEGGRLQK
jgi:hypothetical protein